MNREDTRMYESVVILRPSSSDPEIQKFIDTYTSRLEQDGASMIKVNNWGKRKLAFEVKGERKGIYLCFTFAGRGAIIQTLENINRIDEMILKSMTIRVAKTSNASVLGGEAEEPKSAVV